MRPESAMSGDEGKRANNTAKLERAVGKGLTGRDGEKWKRNGDRQTLSVVRHFVRETQDRKEVKRCEWGRGKRQQLTGKDRRGIAIVH